MDAKKAAKQDFPNPQMVIARFIARRTVRSATFVALILGAFVASKTAGYAAAYPSAHERLIATAFYTNNIGLIALFGTPHHLEVVASFAGWYAMSIGAILGSIWAYLVATKQLRGNEETGRWELLLAGQTTARRAAANALAGLATSLVLLYVIVAVVFITVGQLHDVNFAVGPALYFALAAISGAIVFMAVGAFASQLMPTRARAAGLSTAIFGASFLLRAAADITNAHWLLDITPLGWIEKLQPLYAPQPIWLVPLAALVAVLAIGTVVLAGNRDMGAGFFADHDAAPAHTNLLSGPFGAAVRLTRGNVLAWTVGILAVAAFFGALTKTAAQAFSDSVAASHLLSRLAQGVATLGAKTFLGIVFFILMTVVMSYAASAISAIRSDEAQGYLDNFVVGPIGRLRWLADRCGLTLLIIGLVSILAGIAVWLTTVGQHIGVSLQTLLLAGVNLAVPAILILGIGIFGLGVWPRLTSVIAYGAIAWSFLIQMVSAGLNLSHWLLDSSIFTQVAFAPTTDPKWETNLIIVLVGFVLAAIGAVMFNNRDLATE